MATGVGTAREKAQPREEQVELQTATSPLEEQIRQRAYEIWLQRDGQVGSDTVDWLQAEEEIRRVNNLFP
jgi:hypothetical protein